MSKAYTWWEAHTILEHYCEEALATGASTLSAAIAIGEGKLNRAAKRALGARGDGRFHPLASLKTTIRSRNAW